jgi:hypothetical protein
MANRGLASERTPRHVLDHDSAFCGPLKKHRNLSSPWALQQNQYVAESKEKWAGTIEYKRKFLALRLSRMPKRQRILSI